MSETWYQREVKPLLEVDVRYQQLTARVEELERQLSKAREERINYMNAFIATHER